MTDGNREVTLVVFGKDDAPTLLGTYTFWVVWP